jgi:transposase
MDATSLAPDALLPNDVPTLQQLVRQLLAEIARLRGDYAEVRGKLDAALKHRFGRRSERIPPVAKADKPGQAAPHGRAAIAEQLERRVVVHDLTEAEKLCPCCGQPRVCIGEQTAEQLDLEPARVFVLRTIRKSYACRHCDPNVVAPAERIQTAGPQQVGPLAKGLCGPGLLAHVNTAKFADHTPLHRLVGQLARSGLAIAESTLGDWVAGSADLLDPLVQLMHQRLLLSRVIHGDDTTVKLRVVGSDRTHKAHLWVAIGEADYPYVVFDFTTAYTAAGPELFLKDYRGYLQADALAQYEGLYGEDKIRHCCCWAHARRKFVAAAEGGDVLAREAVERIGQLYAIERDLPPLLPPSDDPVETVARRQREEQRRLWRQQYSKPLLAELKQWLEEHKDKVLPKSVIGQAFGYALNNWEALCRYLEQGYLAIDNNLSERTLRVVALGRNNWGVLGSAKGGQTAAVLYSVVQTCKHLGIDPFEYLREALPGVFALGEKPSTEQLQEWLPDRWLIGRRSRAAPPGQAATG